MSQHRGFSLVEILIGFFLGSIIVLAFSHLYGTVKQQFYEQNQLLMDSMDVQLVVEQMRDGIRRAGFTPCIGLNYLKTIDVRDGRRNLVGIESLLDKKGLFIQRMSEDYDLILKILNPKQMLVGSDVVQKGQVLLIADCAHAEVHKVRTAVAVAKGFVVTLESPLYFEYPEALYVGEWIQERFYTHYLDKKNTSLFYERKRSDELSSRVVSMNANVQNVEEHQLVNVRLGLKNGQGIDFDTRVRA